MKNVRGQGGVGHAKLIFKGKTGSDLLVVHKERYMRPNFDRFYRLNS